MIPEQAIVQWRSEAPWEASSLVEQDLVISRALVEMYSSPQVARSLAFRGGTALYKLHLRPAARYSEDIDLVQIDPGPIGETLDSVRAALDPWLGAPQRKLKRGGVHLVYRFESEDKPPVGMRLKLEINSREQFSELGLQSMPFAVDNQWFQGEANVPSFAIDELLATKLRALYQRRKGRDLFDLWYAMKRGVVDVDVLLSCFLRYMTNGGHNVTRALFEANLHEKAGRRDFRGDMGALLRPGVTWNFDEALELVMDALIARLPGDPWKGRDS